MQVPDFRFNANQHQPVQFGAGHPPATKIPFQITNTEMKETSSKTGGMLVVEFTSPAGVLINRYNVKNDNPKTVEIAMGQLSALCHATGIYNLEGANECAALRGGRGLMDVGYQKGEAPTDNNPEAKGYTELKRVYDAAGNEPGKAPTPAQANAAATQAPQGQAQPLQQQPGGSWGNSQPQGQQPAQQAPNPASAGGAWQPGNSAPAISPPWGSR